MEQDPHLHRLLPHYLQELNKVLSIRSTKPVDGRRIPGSHKVFRCAIRRHEGLRERMMDLHLANLVPPVLCVDTVSYTHLRAHETPEHLVCRLLLEKKKKKNRKRTKRDEIKRK
eukprot:TRINITY_DN8700_c0_g1_i12.p3 TRINITY_DN8700_c0_g1~~TRINITY_DN8700_c0_g1_i12.p3  ORF type:complete len:114 (+),score=18.84 TRINITY_DN8700_c0_g1_i12:1497-1838(+)